jgi:hypothetical protein
VYESRYQAPRITQAKFQARDRSVSGQHNRGRWNPAWMDVEIVGDLADVETIATGHSVRELRVCAACMARAAGGK